MTIDLPANSLINEKSPYLLQHAYNPVHWYPWGDIAFNMANEENKPIFLSIGYSTCHWCHVMAHESFEDDEVADILNEKFICIKVDREERPDIDSIYMRVCQMLTGQGGWPLSVFLTPDQKPFYAGTYYPKHSKYGRPGFIDVITQLYDKYTGDPDHVSVASHKITEALNQTVVDNSQQRLEADTLHKTYKQLANRFDGTYGGFGSSPKFPIPHMLMYLLRYSIWTNEENAITMTKKTLEGMANGGINDHIGFGFARYSTDEMWLVPHFEKMLYDNALLLTAYTEAFQMTSEPRYKEICDQIYTFVHREMTNVNGGFYSALDADTEGIEGKYYVWEKEEVLNILGTEIGDVYCEVYDITDSGNFDGYNIPNLINTNLEKIAVRNNLSVENLLEKIKVAKMKLYEARSKRTYPHVDDKILTAWNAFMIAGLAKGAKVFDNNNYLESAKTALLFIEEKLIVDNRVMVRYRDGEVKIKGFIDDYAFLLWAYIEMYEATLDLNYIKKAKKLQQQMFHLFWDHENGGFYFTGEDVEDLIVREKEIYDGALPSGNGVAAVQLYKLANLTGDLELLDKVTQLFTTFYTQVESYGSGHTFFLQSLLLDQMDRKEIVIIGNKNDEKVLGLLQKVQKEFLPQYSILVAEDSKDFTGIADFAVPYIKIKDSTTIYICENFTCSQPTNEIEQALHQILK